MNIERWALVAAAVVLMSRFRDVMFNGGFCLECGGHGDHRDDCPRK